MPPLAAADAFLVLDLVAGNRQIPFPVFSALLAALPSVSPHTSPRLRKAIALRALGLALALEDLSRARAVLADPDLASCFPGHLASCDDLHDLKRLVDAEWATLPDSVIELAADRIVGAGAPQTWANADQDTRRKLRLLVGESTEREMLGKLGQVLSKVSCVEKAANAPITDANEVQVHEPASKHSTSDASEAHHAQQVDEAHLGRGNDKASHLHEVCARHQQEPVQGSDNSPPVIGGSKPSLMERNPTAKVSEWDDLGDSESERPPRKRQLPAYEMKRRPPPAFPQKTRKKWSEIQEKTLIEGVEKHGKGNWKDIKTAYPAVFADRSAVDLKDKFRNLERYIVN